MWGSYWLGEIKLRHYGDGWLLVSTPRNPRLGYWQERWALVRWLEDDKQFMSLPYPPRSGALCALATGHTIASIESVADWVSESTARRRLKEVLYEDA